MTLYQELLDAVQSQNFQPQSDSQTDEEYIISLLLALASIPEGDWRDLSRKGKLSKAAIDWYNTTAQLVNDKKPYQEWPHLQGFKEEIVVPEKAIIDSGKKKVVRTVRAMLMSKPELSSRAVWKFLNESSFPGISFNMVSVICSETRSFIMLAQELGYWKESADYGQHPLTEEEQMKYLESVSHV